MTPRGNRRGNNPTRADRRRGDVVRFVPHAEQLIRDADAERERQQALRDQAEQDRRQAQPYTTPPEWLSSEQKLKIGLREYAGRQPTYYTPVGGQMAGWWRPP